MDKSRVVNYSGLDKFFPTEFQEGVRELVRRLELESIAISEGLIGGSDSIVTVEGSSTFRIKYKVVGVTVTEMMSLDDGINWHITRVLTLS